MRTSQLSGAGSLEMMRQRALESERRGEAVVMRDASRFQARAGASSPRSRARQLARSHLLPQAALSPPSSGTSCSNGVSLRQYLTRER